MTANLQLGFYRNPMMWPDEVLVRFQHNEREVSIPVPSDMNPYSGWKEVESFYERLLAE